MLKSMSVKNFIHFQDRQELTFEDGVNFIFGANSTGKTACFELLRRCLSNKINKTTSSIPNKGELAYVVCHFKVTGNFPRKDVENVIACIFVERDYKSLNKCIFYKVLCPIIKNGTSEVHIQRCPGQYGCIAKELEKESLFHDVNCNMGTDFSPICKIINGNSSEMNEMTLFDEIRDTLTKTECKISNSIKMDIVYKYLEDRYVGVMAMRSFGPIQWTKSANLRSDKNYRIASDRAEILNALLDSDKIDKTLEQKYHQSLTFPFEFNKTENGIEIKNIEKEGESFPLLKCPEGIVEAKQLTLILSHMEYSTITLEEPDRGMHPHMIKKMRDLILRNIKGKTVLIITHNPSMINQWTLGRCFVFSKTGENVNISHNIRKFEEKKWRSYNNIEEIKCVLFSPRVLFVEGITDKLVLEAIFSFLTTNANSPIAGKAGLKDYLLATEVIELQGAKKGKPKRKMCKELMKETFILYDFDHFKSNNTRVHGGEGDNKEVDFDKVYQDITEFLSHDFDEFEKACESSRVFCWKSGDLEDIILDIKDKLPEDVSTRIAGNDKNEKSVIKETIKKNIANGRLTDIDVLAETLVINSGDVKRFIHFFEKMLEKDMPSLSDKRKYFNTENMEELIYKRLKSNETNEQMSIDNDNYKTGLQRPELLHSGISDIVDDMELDDEDNC